MDITSYILGKNAGGGGGTPNLQTKSVTITENTTTNAENFDNKFGNIWLSSGGRLVFYASYDNTEKNIVIPNINSASGIIGIQLERS